VEFPIYGFLYSCLFLFPLFSMQQLVYTPVSSCSTNTATTTISGTIHLEHSSDSPDPIAAYACLSDSSLAQVSFVPVLSSPTRPRQPIRPTVPQWKLSTTQSLNNISRCTYRTHTQDQSQILLVRPCTHLSQLFYITRVKATYASDTCCLLFTCLLICRFVCPLTSCFVCWLGYLEC